MTHLPRSPAALAKLCRRIEVHARKLADEQERKTFDTRSDEVQNAVREAVGGIYLGDKLEPRLWRIVELLAPEIATLMSDQGSDVAYRVLHPGDEDE